MRVILILFLILFVIISSLFLTTFFSQMTSSRQALELTEEEQTKDESISIIPDTKPDAVSEVQGLENPLQDEMGSSSADALKGEDDQITLNEIQDTEEEQNNEEQNSVQQSEVTPEQSSSQDSEDPEQDTIKIYLDGDMENGIYLGIASYGINSSRASEFYGPELADTGFRFEWDSTDLELEPGSTHFLYIYYYNTESGWDHIRKEINITGQKPGDTDIKIFIDEPVGQKSLEKLTRVKGWTLDATSLDNTGIGKVRIYLDGPMDFGQNLGDVAYGIPRSGVVEFFNNENYLYSGFNLNIEDLDPEPGSKHTLFVYAENSDNPNLYNFEKTDIYFSGKKEEKAVIEATISLQKLASDNKLYIEGYAIEIGRLEEFLNQQKEEGIVDPTEGVNSQYSASGEYSIQKLVFKSNRDGNENIYSINIDGSGWQRLTDYNGADLYPEASPDGKKIAYTSDIKGIWQIMVMDWNGQNKRQITHNSFRSAYPSWSYDMKYIYFEAFIDGDWELYRINSNGTGQKRLTHNSAGHDWHPSGHPFDTKIIFESGMPGHDDIYIMNHDGSSVSRIFNTHERRRTPDLSSDSTKITYTRYFGNNSEVYYTDIRDQNEIRVTHNGDWDGHPMFSPDGKLIVYEERSGGKEDLIIFNIETGEKTNITNTGHNDNDACFMYQK
jgi:Tol biopolymer transport system component